MKTYLYRLKFKSPVHFGASGIGLENSLYRLTSDSIFSALLNSFSLIGDVDAVIEALKSSNSPFVVSSLFPFGPDDTPDILYAFPQPLTTPVVCEPDILKERGKELKRIRYLQLEDVIAWLSEEPLSQEQVEALVTRGKKIANHLDTETGESWYTTELRPRVALDRVSQNSSLWFCGAVHFHPEAGLYGLIKISDETWKKKLEDAFYLLGELGLGGERTYGMGMFEFSGFESIPKEWESCLIKKLPYSMLLSCYYPSKDEIDHFSENFEAWDFFETRGYIVSGLTAKTLKRKRIRMVLEGSVLKRKVRGSIQDVTPDNAIGLNHRVYRSGLAFQLPEGGNI
jgi:CRISPR-associated protein Csm4